MDDIWTFLVPVLTATAGFFLRALVDVTNRAIREVWNECKTRRRHQEELVILQHQHAHIVELREVDLRRDIVTQGMKSTNYNADVND